MIFFFKKSLGQHFLRDENVLKNIVLLENIKDQTVVEIGPGKGALTKVILNENPKKLFLIEKDKSLIPYLNKIEQMNSNIVKVIHNDALKINFKKLDDNQLILIANLPYNIASTLIINLLRESNI